MTLYIGVDIHPYRQTVAYCRTEDGEIRFRSFKHEDKGALKAFYGGFDESAVVGVEATGSLDWFEDMIFENGHEFLVGNPYETRRRAKSRHKSDKRDTETILDLLVNGEFPSIGRRSREERGLLQLLSFRQHLVVNPKILTTEQEEQEERRHSCIGLAMVIATLPSQYHLR